MVSDSHNCMGKIDSLTIQKGLCSITVFSTHFFTVTESYGIAAIDKLLNYRMIGVLKSGDLAVDIFIIICAYLAAIKIFDQVKFDWTFETVKRYIRISIPCAVTAGICALLKLLNLFSHYEIAQLKNIQTVSWWWCKAELNIISFIKSILFGIPFDGDSQYYPAFWMMKYIFLGTILAYVIAFVVKGGSKWFSHMLLLFLSLYFIVYNDPYYWGIIIGIWIAYIRGSLLDKWLDKLSPVVCILGYVIGRYSLTITEQPKMTTIRCISALLILKGFMGIWAYAEEKWQLNKIFSILRSMMVELGNLSFGIFLTHFFVVGTFSSWWYLKFHNATGLMQCGINYIISFVIILVLSGMYKLIVENYVCTVIFNFVKNKIKMDK